MVAVEKGTFYSGEKGTRKIGVDTSLHKTRFAAQHDKNSTNKFMSSSQDCLLIRQPVLLSFLEV